MSCRIFISCVTSEFETLRKRLRSYLTKADCEVKTQEDFNQSDVDIVEKLADYIQQCDAIIHIIGHDPGYVADEKPRSEFLANNTNFLSDKPGLRAALGDCSDLTYTQWEAFIAIHHGRSIRAYHFADAQPEHRKRLKLGLNQRYSTEVSDESDIFGALIGDLRKIIPDLPSAAAHRITNIPASIGTLFKGRDETLVNLSDSLTKSHHTTAITAPKAIYGLGGIGKTRLAIEYGRRFADDYTALLIVRADSPANFRRNLADLAGPLVLPEFTEPEDTRLEAALRWLEDHPKWYLIIDNVDTEEAMAEVQTQLDRLTAGHVVITSRLSDWAGGVETLDLSVLDEVDAIDFLHERTDARRPKAATDAEDVRALVKKLDGLALALEQAGAYIAERRLTFAKYLAHWETRRKDVLKWHNETKMRYPASVAITWQTSFKELIAPAKTLLKILSQLAPDPLPRGIIELESDTNGLLEDAFIELERYSLIRILEEPPDTFAVHRLVQEIVRESSLQEEFSDSSDQFQAQEAEVEDPNLKLKHRVPHWLQAGLLLENWAPSGGQDISTWDAWTVLDPHLEIIFEKSSHHLPNPDPPPIPYLLSGFGSFQQFRNGAYSVAEALSKRDLAASERDLGLEHPDTLTSVNNLATFLQAKGDHAAAEPLFRRALEAKDRILGPEHPDTLSCVNNLALLLESNGNLADAEPLFRRTQETREQVLGPEHPDTLTSVNNLALLLKSKGDLVEAESLYRWALEARERVLGQEHPDTLGSVNNLAMLLESKGDLVGAEPLYLRAYEGFLAKLGPGHPNTKAVKDNWKKCLKEMEKEK